MDKIQDEPTLADLEKQVDELTKKLAAMSKKDEDPSEDETEVDETPVEKKVVKRVALKTKKNFAAGEDEEVEDDWSEEADSKKKGKFPFPAKKAAPSDDESEDETVEIEGVTMSKNTLGEAQFEAFKALSKSLVERDERLAKSEKDLQKALEKAEKAELSKLASETMTHVTGTHEEHVAILKSMKGMDEKTRKAFQSVLDSQEKIGKDAFATLGTKGPDGEELQKTAADFMKRVEEIVTKDKLTRTEAMSKARKLFPEEHKAFQGAN